MVKRVTTIFLTVFLLTTIILPNLVSAQSLIAYWKFDEGNLCVRDDDGGMEGSAYGDAADDGAKKWLIVNTTAVVGDTVALWVYGQAVNCNSTAGTDYRLRVDEDPSKEITFNWCDMFGLDTGTSLQSSAWEWKKFDISKSWLIDGENSFTFWDRGGACSYQCANWRIGVDLSNFVSRSGWCCNCGQGSNPPTINKGNTGTCGETQQGELMMTLSTDMASDSSGNGNHGTLSPSCLDCPQWTSDSISGTALNFDGTNDYVDAGIFDVAGSGLTIMAWFKADDFDVGDGRIISKATSQVEQEHHWMLSTITSGTDYRLRFRLKTGTNPSTGTTTLIATSGNLYPGEWVHAAAVYDGTNMLLYKDGAFVGSTPKTGTISTNNTASVWIGDNPGPYRKQFDGIIDEVKVYDHALTSEEIADEYKKGTLVGHWKFNEGSGSIAYDSSYYANNGIINGDPQWVSGMFAQALEFDGVGDYVNVGNPSVLQLTGDMTISFWTYPTNVAEARENPIDKAYCGEFALTQETGGSLSYYQGPNGGETSGYMSRSWGGVFVNDDWVHIAIVRDVSAQSIRLYKDGIDQGEGGTSWADPSASNEPITIGDGYAGSGYHGIIDEVKIWNRALTADEISEESAPPPPPPPPGPVILIPGEITFTIEPMILEYIKLRGVTIEGTGEYLNVEWDVYYWSGKEADVGVKCYLNCEWPEANDYDIENNCAANQNCMYVGATGVGGCSIESPQYIYQNTESNNVTCKFYDPSDPGVIYLPFPRVDFIPIAFDIHVAPQAKATVGEPFNLQVTIKNTGIAETSYNVNVSSSYDFVHVENGFIPETETIEWNETTSVSPKVRIDLTQTATLFVKVKANADPVTCSVDADCSYIGVCGMETPICDVDNRCAKQCAVQIGVSKKGLPEFGVFGILQLMLIPAFVLFVSQKKLLSVKSN